MQTLIIDVINNKALRLLQDLELLELIRVHKDENATILATDWEVKYKGAMAKQSVAEIDKQLDELRSEWD